MKVGYQILADLQQQQAFKQWGINTGGAVRTSTLPIPFTNVFLAVASTSSEWCCPGCSATNTTVTTRAYQSNRPDVAQPNDVNWIIIGCQPQWGFIARNANTTFTFPIMFTTLYAAMRTAYGVSGRDPSWDEIAIPSATIKQINLGSCYWASYVIAIGI